jgi:hypothetical protein
MATVSKFPRNSGSAAVRSAAMMMREFSIDWKLNFCIKARSVDQKQKYVGK